MARRSRTTRVLLSGDVVDNRQRFQTRDHDAIPASTKPAPAKAPEPEQKKPQPRHEGPESAHQRLRRPPKVIDARKAPGADGKVLSRDEPEGGAEAAGKAWETPAPANPTADIAPPRKLTPLPGIELIEEDPRPRPSGDIAPPPAAAPALKPAAAKTMVDSMVGRLRAEAERKGSLTVDDLTALKAEFDRQAKKLSVALERSFDTYVEAKERAEWGLKRELPFDWVIVKAFSELFLEQDYSRFDRVSRRMLPGFFMALNMMLGEDLVSEYQEQCQLIVSRLREERGKAFDWEQVYVHPQAKALMLDAAVTIATYFTDYTRRSTWFIDLINANLGSLGGAPREEAGWEMTPSGFKRFLDRLFAELREKLATDSGKLRLTKRHGADVCAKIFEILATIET
ncbi:MAG: hypothetical protein VW338_04170 [Rhodospirillaceae bacterium]